MQWNEAPEKIVSAYNNVFVNISEKLVQAKEKYFWICLSQLHQYISTNVNTQQLMSYKGSCRGMREVGFGISDQFYWGSSGNGIMG